MRTSLLVAALVAFVLVEQRTAEATGKHVKCVSAALKKGKSAGNKGEGIKLAAECLKAKMNQQAKNQPDRIPSADQAELEAIYQEVRNRMTELNNESPENTPIPDMGEDLELRDPMYMLSLEEGLESEAQELGIEIDKDEELSLCLELGIEQEDIDLYETTPLDKATLTDFNTFYSDEDLAAEDEEEFLSFIDNFGNAVDGEELGDEGLANDFFNFDELDVFEGEIDPMLGVDQDTSDLYAYSIYRRKRMAIYNEANKANHGKIFKYSFRFDKNFKDSTKDNQQIVNNIYGAVKSLEATTCLKFQEVPWENGQPNSANWKNSGGVLHKDTEVYSIILVGEQAGCGAWSTLYWRGGIGFFQATCKNNYNSIRTMLHEMCHGLGISHEQIHGDRNKYIQAIDGSAPVSKSGFASITYDHAGTMHYPVYEKDGKPVYQALDKWYHSTTGTNWDWGSDPSFDVMSFRYLKNFNKIYQCNACANSGTKCFNKGFPDVNDCTKCVCPEGFSGAKCDEVETNKDRATDGNNCGKEGSKPCTRCPTGGCERFLKAKEEWQTLEANFGPGGQGQTCTWYIKSPADTKIEMEVTRMYSNSNKFTCSTHKGGTWLELKMGIDPAASDQTVPDFERTGYRLCMAPLTGSRTSVGNLVVAKSRYNSDKPFEFTIKYRSVSASGAYNYPVALRNPQASADCNTLVDSGSTSTPVQQPTLSLEEQCTKAGGSWGGKTCYVGNCGVRTGYKANWDACSAGKPAGFTKFRLAHIKSQTEMDAFKKATAKCSTEALTGMKSINDGGKDQWQNWVWVDLASQKNIPLSTIDYKPEPIIWGLGEKGCVSLYPSTTGFVSFDCEGVFYGVACEYY